MPENWHFLHRFVMFAQISKICANITKMAFRKQMGKLDPHSRSQHQF